MVEVSNHNDCKEPWIRNNLLYSEIFDMLTPVADLEPREAVVLDNVCDSIHRRCVRDSPNHGANTDVGHDDFVALRFHKKNRVG